MRYLLILILFVFVSCKKETHPPVHSATITAYSVHTPYMVSYSDVNGDHTETVTTNNYSKTFDVTESNYQVFMGVDNIGTTFPDSIYVRADVNGKTVSNSFAINCPCDATAYIQLSQAQ